MGAAAFRELIYFFTWVFTGRETFGQQGHAASLHLPFLGVLFVLVVPADRRCHLRAADPALRSRGAWARRAGGHGGGGGERRAHTPAGHRRQGAGLRRCASAAAGRSAARGRSCRSAPRLRRRSGQLVRMSEGRLRVIVACGAAGGISATFNAPVTGMFFGFEIVLKEFSLDALAATILSSVTADVISRAFFGGAPFFAAIPHDMAVGNDFTLSADRAARDHRRPDRRGLPEDPLQGRGRRRRAVGQAAAVAAPSRRRAPPRAGAPGAAADVRGRLPVMDRVLANHYVLWFVVILMVGKILAASLTLWIGGSGGVFAPSLFIGAAAGMAFGIIVNHLFGPAVGPPAIYGVVAMGAVFAAAAQAPLTAIASVAEMTGNFTLTLPIMLACGIAAQLAKQITYGSIYTTKLLRRGIDIERPKALGALQAVTVGEVMQPVNSLNGEPLLLGARSAEPRPAVTGHASGSG